MLLRKILLATVVLFVFAVQISGQERIVIGSAQEDMAHALTMYQGKYYIFGTTRKDSVSAKDYYLIKLRSNGTVEKRITYGFPNHDIGNHVLVDEQGVFILGSAYDFGFPNVDMHLVKLNDNGVVEWENFYGSESQELGFKFIRTRDGGFALIGFSNAPSPDGGDMYCVKTDKNGTLLWENFFGPSKVDYGFSLVENNNEEILFAGTENGYYNPTQTEFETLPAQILVVKTDKNGNELWYKTYGGDGHDWCKDIIAAPDGGYYLTGSTQSSGAGSFDVFLMKIDENGNKLWFTTYGGQEFDYGEKLQIGADGNIYISASSASYSDNLKPDHFIIKTDLNGNTLWSKIIGTDGSDYTSGLVATADSGVVFTGWSTIGEFGRTDIVFYKLSKNGETDIISNINTNDSVTSVVVYPNPATTHLLIDVLSINKNVFHFLLFNVSGQKIMEKEVFSNQTNKIGINVKNGIYYYVISDDENNSYSGKIIISN